MLRIGAYGIAVNPAALTFLAAGLAHRYGEAFYLSLNGALAALHHIHA